MHTMDNQPLKGYESGHDASGHPKSKRSTEDTQEDAEGIQQGHGLKAVAVVSRRLVRHNGAEAQIDREYTQIKHLRGKNKTHTY